MNHKRTGREWMREERFEVSKVTSFCTINRTVSIHLSSFFFSTSFYPQVTIGRHKIYNDSDYLLSGSKLQNRIEKIPCQSVFITIVIFSALFISKSEPRARNKLLKKLTMERRNKFKRVFNNFFDSNQKTFIIYFRGKSFPMM